MRVEWVKRVPAHVAAAGGLTGTAEVGTVPTRRCIVARQSACSNPACGKPIDVPRSVQGAAIYCPHCGTQQPIPHEALAAADRGALRRGHPARRRQ